MTSIGRRYTGSNVLSRAILITQTLSGDNVPPKHQKQSKPPCAGLDDGLPQSHIHTDS